MSKAPVTTAATTTPEPTLTHEELHAQVRDALLNDPRTPTGVRLGKKQVDVIIGYNRAIVGSDDIGPLVEFAGVPIVASTSADELVLEYADPAPAEAAPASG